MPYHTALSYMQPAAVHSPLSSSNVPGPTHLTTTSQLKPAVASVVIARDPCIDGMSPSDRFDCGDTSCPGVHAQRAGPAEPRPRAVPHARLRLRARAGPAPDLQARTRPPKVLRRLFPFLPWQCLSLPCSARGTTRNLTCSSQRSARQSLVQRHCDATQQGREEHMKTMLQIIALFAGTAVRTAAHHNDCLE